MGCGYVAIHASRSTLQCTGCHKENQGRTHDGGFPFMCTYRFQSRWKAWNISRYSQPRADDQLTKKWLSPSLGSTPFSSA